MKGNGIGMESSTPNSNVGKCRRSIWASSNHHFFVSQPPPSTTATTVTSSPPSPLHHHHISSSPSAMAVSQIRRPQPRQQQWRGVATSPTERTPDEQQEGFKMPRCQRRRGRRRTTIESSSVVFVLASSGEPLLVHLFANYHNQVPRHHHWQRGNQACPPTAPPRVYNATWQPDTNDD